MEGVKVKTHAAPDCEGSFSRSSALTRFQLSYTPPKYKPVTKATAQRAVSVRSRRS